MTIDCLLASYFQTRTASVTYRYNFENRVAALAAHAGESDAFRLFTEPLVNAFLRSLPCSPQTVRSYRASILALWSFAADLDLTDYPVHRRIWSPACPAPLIDCYTLDEARALLTTAARLLGEYPNGVAKRLYWGATIRLAWDSGLRRGDVWAFRRDAVRPDGSALVLQHKTGQVVPVKLRPSTVAALDLIPRPAPCAWPLDPSFFGRHFKRLVREAKVCRGTFRWLRRSSGSYVEWQQPGAGHKQLGNGPDVFQRNYDAKLGGATWPQPPPLD